MRRPWTTPCNRSPRSECREPVCRGAAAAHRPLPRGKGSGRRRLRPGLPRPRRPVEPARGDQGSAPGRLVRPEDAEAYLAEARVVASLDHPNIVPGLRRRHAPRTACASSSRSSSRAATLPHEIREARPSPTQSAELVATVAEALHYAHRKGLVHRDIKPANILLDAAGKPYVADFGLALKEEDFGKGAGFAGTPAYMSPEQARGEGHRVDGRSRHLQPGRGLLRTADRAASLSGPIRRRNCWSRSRRSRPARPGRWTTPFPRNWNASASRRCRSGPRSGTRRPRTWPTTCGTGCVP